MKPIGLTFKNIKTNPFTGRTSGELMIVHLCLNCGKISPNRIAGDDNSYSITNLIDTEYTPDNKIVFKLNTLRIRLLTAIDKPEVLASLFGYIKSPL